MNLEDQVCSLELAIKLKKLAVKQESYFKWEERENGDKEVYHSKATSCTHKYYSAFTVAELGEILNEETYSRRMRKFEGWYCTYIRQGIEERLRNTIAKTEADARANMLIYLLENRLIKNE